MEQLQSELAESQQELAKNELQKEQFRTQTEKLQAEINLLEEQNQTITQLQTRENRITNEIHNAEMARAKDSTDSKNAIESKKLDLKEKEIEINAELKKKELDMKNNKE
jgi:hypothetical protein